MKGEAYYFGREEVVNKVGCLPVSSGMSMDIRLNDAKCQLKSVGCVVGPDNVWANVQKGEDPSIINFDLDNTKCWQPFFNNNNRQKYLYSNEIGSIQPLNLIYTQPKMNNDEFAIRIQRFIAQKFQDERIRTVNMTTKWNVAVGDKLRNILFYCEMYRMKARQGATNSELRGKNRQNANEDLDVAAISEKIKKATEEDANGKRSWGFPINITFVTMDLLWEEVKNTKLHAVMDRNAEFSLSVDVKAYSCNIVSVWLYLAAFTRHPNR